MRYEFSKLLTNFDIDQYAQFKFENLLNQILSDGNLYRIVRSANDFFLRHDYVLFGEIGKFDSEIGNSHSTYDSTRQALAALAEELLLQWQSLPSAKQRIALLKGKIPVAITTDHSPNSGYVNFYGRLWKFWNN